MKSLCVLSSLQMHGWVTISGDTANDSLEFGRNEIIDLNCSFKEYGDKFLSVILRKSMYFTNKKEILEISKIND